MFRILAHSLKTGILTRRDPFQARPAFGFPAIDFAACTGCGDCAAVCPTPALQVVPEAPARLVVSLSYAACIQCRACVESCGERAIRNGREHEVAAYTREHLTRRATYDVEEASGRARLRAVEAVAGPTIEQSAAALRDRIRGRLRRSLHVRQVDAGSCNACELEIIATTNPVYDLERFGIHFVASPRHADVLLVTGPVTRNMEIALRRTYEATPEPRVVVAVGACGCSGGLFGEGTYASVGGVDRVLPVDVYVPGCPPRPQAILNGLLVAMDVRAARSEPGAELPEAGQTDGEPAGALRIGPAGGQGTAGLEGQAKLTPR